MAPRPGRDAIKAPVTLRPSRDADLFQEATFSTNILSLSGQPRFPTLSIYPDGLWRSGLLFLVRRAKKTEQPKPLRPVCSTPWITHNKSSGDM